MPRTPAPEPAPEPTPEPTVVVAPSVLDRVRANRMGPPAVGLAVAILVGLLFSVLVPREANVLALILLGTLVAAAVGFSVRYLSLSRGLATQTVAFVSTLVGVHLMAVTGSVNGAGGGGIGGIVKLPIAGWDDALLVALATPMFSTGTILAGLIAAMIAGFGPRSEHDHWHHRGHEHHDHA